MKKQSYLSLLCIISQICLASCGMMPQIASEAEHIIDDTAITVKCSQEAISKNSDIKINLELNNSKP